MLFWTGPVFAKDFNMYHTVFLLAILGGIGLILLCLLCLLLYYCRFVKGRHQYCKLNTGVSLF